MKLTKTAFLVASMMMSSSAFAEHSFTAHGRVIHSSPVYRTIEVERENHHCRDRHQSHSGYSNSRHDKKQHHTRTYSTAKSTKMSNSVKHSRYGQHDNHSNHNDSHRPNRDHGRCARSRHYETKRILKGFDVTYRYKGDTYHIFTKHRPGRRITLNISISPQY